MIELLIICISLTIISLSGLLILEDGKIFSCDKIDKRKYYNRENSDS